jgi:deoxyribonuclease-4
MSVAGGLPRAVERGVVHGCDAMQIFAKNASQWRGRLVSDDEAAEFRSKVRRAGLTPVVSHASYLINLATASGALADQSFEAMRDELDRADTLDLLGVVLHPGCYTAGNAAEGLRLIADRLTELLRIRRNSRTMVLLEHTAGQGTALGASFDELATIIEHMRGHSRVGVCLDTCHLFASGYDISTPEGYASTFKQFGRLVGFERLRMFHVNDSKKPLGSRVDRHTHIGEGAIGLEAFRRLLNDRRFQDLPMLLETPKEEGKSRSQITADKFDMKNLATLRSLIE